MFDFFGNGSLLKLAWPTKGSSNGWLALDGNGNGKIDSAKELFGNITEQPLTSSPNGFLALAVFDKPNQGGNDDGAIDERDKIWPRLLVWIDKSHDGISQKDELFSLDQIGITSIMPGYTSSSLADVNGNWFRYQGSLKARPNDPTERVIYDVFLVNSTEVGKK